MKPVIQIPVRDLVDHSLRTGDLEPPSFGAGRRQDAIRIHQRIQQSRPSGYRAEVTVSRRVETERFTLVVAGRIDGLDESADPVAVEEIKTMPQLPEKEEDTDPRHWAQAHVYAAILAAERGLSLAAVVLTCADMETGEVRSFRREWSAGELEAFFTDLVGRYLEWADRLARHRAARDESLQGLKFSFPGTRPGQETLMDAVRDTIARGGRLIAEAPTGIGKTAAVLFPAVQAIRREGIDTVFYLTARTTGAAMAEETLDAVRSAGAHLVSLTLTAKEKICFLPGAACTGEECLYAAGYYDRIGGAVVDALDRASLTREAVAALADAHRVCPFAFALDVAPYADVVIGDYNYVFDPRVYLRRFFDEGGGRYLFLVDEVHNLPDRAREMFSADLRKSDFLALRRAVKTEPSLYRILSRLNAAMLALLKAGEGLPNPRAEDECPSELVAWCRRFAAAAERRLADEKPAPFLEQLLERYFETTAFIRTAERFDGRYQSCYDADGRDITVRLFCVEPAPHIAEGLARARSAVLFSATLRPPGFFRDRFGCGEETAILTLPSPFPPEHRLLMVADRVSTLYRHRDLTRDEIARLIAAFALERTGNYLAFFPSYEYLRLVAERIAGIAPGLDLLIQDRGMSEDDRARFLDRFEHNPSRTLLGLAVMGGIFGEGIDLAGERLTGAVIVGVGLPGLSLERDLIRGYHDAEGADGYDIAYRLPGIARVFQAAGRVIRSETDRGAILLVDRRFAETRYRRLYPPDWRPLAVRNPAGLSGLLRRFWYDEYA